MDLQLRGKAAIVTGASRGLGREIAVAFAREGADVGICARDADRLEAVAREITALGRRCVAVPADLAAPGECPRVIDELARGLGRVDILVNNASSFVDGLGRLDVDAPELLMERVLGKAAWSIQCTQAAFPHLRDAGGGRIVFIGGTSARSASSANGGSGVVSGMGNAAIVTFAKYVSQQWAEHQILANVIHPGNTKTDRFQVRAQRKADADGTSFEVAAAALEAATPLGRLVDPADVAPLVLLLSSHLGSAITGQTIAIDGGVSPAIVY